MIPHHKDGMGCYGMLINEMIMQRKLPDVFAFLLDSKRISNGRPTPRKVPSVCFCCLYLCAARFIGVNI